MPVPIFILRNFSSRAFRLPSAHPLQSCFFPKDLFAAKRPVLRDLGLQIKLRTIRIAQSIKAQKHKPCKDCIRYRTKNIINLPKDINDAAKRYADNAKIRIAECRSRKTEVS